MSASEIPVTELISFDGSPTLLADASNGDYTKVYAVSEAVDSRPGIETQSFGRVIGTDEFLVFNCWGDIKYYEAAAGDEAFMTDLATKHIAPLVDWQGSKEPMRQLHVPFKPWPPADGLKGPIINVVIGQLKSNDDEEALTKLLEEKLLPILKAHKGSTGVSSAYAKANDAETGKKVLVVVSGWESLEACLDEFRKTDEYISFTNELDPLFEIKKDAHVEIHHWKGA